jgi:hypothetical protein
MRVWYVLPYHWVVYTYPNTLLGPQKVDNARLFFNSYVIRVKYIPHASRMRVEAPYDSEARIPTYTYEDFVASQVGKGAAFAIACSSEWDFLRVLKSTRLLKKRYGHREDPLSTRGSPT